MRILQIIGWLLILVAGMFGIYEFVQYLRHTDWVLTDLGQAWSRLHAPSLGYVQGFMKSNVSPELWAWLIRLPMIMVTGVLGGIFLFIDYALPHRRSADL